MPHKIYEYLDYRKFLQDFYEFKKNANASYSYRMLSDKIGFKTKDFILRVMRGDKNLSNQSIPMVAKGLTLGSIETKYFEALVNFNQVKSSEEKSIWYDKLISLQKTARFTDTQALLTHHQYQVYSDWRHLAIRSVIGIHGFQGDLQALANSLIPKLSLEEVTQSIELLESCKLIKRTKKGYELCQSSITTGATVPKGALQGFHQHCLKLGAKSIDTLPASKRNISGLTLGISEEGYNKILEKLVTFRKEIAQIADEDNNADRVYQMSLLLFPMSEPIKKEP